MDGPQTTLFTAILIAVVSLTVFLVYFFVILLRQQRINRRLFEEKLRTEIETLEKERKRMVDSGGWCGNNFFRIVFPK